MSVVPPAGHGQISVTGFEGKAWPSAAPAKSRSAASSGPTTTRFIPPPPPADNINFPLSRQTSLLDPNRSDLVAGVAGAGTMGRGIAQVLATCGARTLVYDAQPGAAQKGKASIAQ